uniref:Putative secreted protein n=1 Tax=Ixodes ricinus TaxID=34613 RepID=A0A6B0UMX2_IXORI
MSPLGVTASSKMAGKPLAVLVGFSTRISHASPPPHILSANLWTTSPGSCTERGSLLIRSWGQPRTTAKEMSCLASATAPGVRGTGMQLWFSSRPFSGRPRGKLQLRDAILLPTPVSWPSS